MRPSADRVREALYARLGELSGARVLDLFAGTGALGIEALSRGADGAVFVERAKAPLASLRANLEDLDLRSASRVLPGDVVAALRRLGGEGARFELILMDPPYAAEGIEDVLAGVVAAGLLAPGGMLVIECSRRHPPGGVVGLECLDERRYGDTLIRRYALAPPERGKGSAGEGDTEEP